jgi:uroporphyrinogen-III synthase
MACHLAGKGILVTRAAHQAAGLADLIESHGGRAIRFPALAIGPAPDPAAAEALLRQAWDLAIFISPNAVRHAARLLAPGKLNAAHIAAVGEATAGALREAGLAPDLLPDGRFDSEGLLALPALQQMRERRVLIVRGEGGRPLLGDSLRARGAKVGYAEVYRRERPAADPQPLLGRWRNEVDIVTATSAEVLENLVTILGQAGWTLLRETPLMVISQRMAARAGELGFSRVMTAPGADDATLFAALCEWVASYED